MNRSDTIAAIATPRGVGGIAVIRISGPDAQQLALRHLNVDTLEPRHTVYCHFFAGTTASDRCVENALDDVVAIHFPIGYSGEPTVEISCHGSLYLQQALLQALLEDGARLAEPGEFTLRAFLNGRLDLSQAEAVADLIEATTPAQHRLATSQLRGGYAAELKSFRSQLLDLTSLLELELDFSQEDVEFADRKQLQELVDRLHQETTRLINSFRIGNAIKNGIPVAIVGQPNAGKSTLLNALLNDDRAIVSPIPGTTRDTIEETLVIDGIPFRFIDTAGLRNSNDPVELLGIERSRKAISSAEIVLHIVDPNDTTDNVEWIEEEIKHQGKKSLLVINKADLLPEPHYGIIGSTRSPTSVQTLKHSNTQTFKHSNIVYISAMLGKGITELKQGLVEKTGLQRDINNVLLSNLRHLDAIKHIEQALDHVIQGLADNIPADLVAVDLRDALYHLGTITGDVTSDEVLGNIFSRFCVGK